jgi:virulence-associated protein VapD
MFAISFDMLISDLKANYGDPYNNAYFEIATILEQFEFYRGQGSVYLTRNNDMSNLLRV